MPGPSPLYRPKFSRSQLAETRKLLRSVTYPMPLSSEPNWSCFWPRSLRSQTPRPDGNWGSTRIPSGTGGNDGRSRDWFSRIVRGQGVRPSFPPQEIVAIKAIACELPATYDRP